MDCPSCLVGVKELPRLKKLSEPVRERNRIAGQSQWKCIVPLQALLVLLLCSPVELIESATFTPSTLAESSGIQCTEDLYSSTIDNRL